MQSKVKTMEDGVSRDPASDVVREVAILGPNSPDTDVGIRGIVITPFKCTVPSGGIHQPMIQEEPCLSLS